MLFIKSYYNNCVDEKDDYNCPCPLSEHHPEMMIAFNFEDVRNIILYNFYGINIEEFMKMGKQDYILVDSENETFDEFVLKISDNEYITIENIGDCDVIDLWSPEGIIPEGKVIGKIEYDTLRFVYEYLTPNVEYTIRYTARPISYSNRIKKEIDDLREENDSLLKRNAFLECEPYRGPEFFKMMKEEFDKIE